MPLSAAISPGSLKSLDSSTPSLNKHEDAGPISRMLVTWLTPLLSLGYKRPLEASDLPRLSAGFRSSHLSKKLQNAWNIRENTVGKYRLLWACLDAHGKPFYWAGLLKLVGDMCGLTSPMILGRIIGDLKGGAANLQQGLLLCLLIFGLQMINTLTVNSYFTITMQAGMKTRTGISILVYNKALCLSGKARQGFSTGQIVNLMSTDGGRVDMAASYLHYVWSGPFQIVIILVLLFKLLGWAAFVGFGTLVVFIPIQGKITTLLSRYRKETSATTDKRVRLMQEIIQGIRVIKFYAWEKSFLGKLFELREQELNRVGKAQTIKSLMVVMTSFTSIFACIVTFIVYYWSGNSLTAEIVFPTLALFNLLRLPLILLPMVINMAVDGSVSIKRLQKFLLAEELDFAPIVDEISQNGVVINNGTFVWETLSDSHSKKDDKMIESPKESIVVKTIVNPSSVTSLLPCPQTPASASLASPISSLTPDSFTKAPLLNYAVQDINIVVPKGTLVAIIGPVGAGKSSLLNAMIGELKCISGNVHFGGSVAYCPQQAWIQNATARDNILFGAPFDAQKYEQVVQACALEADFAMLPDNDMTEIGEKGVNLSGGQKQRISLARAAYNEAEIVLLDDPLSAVDAHVGKHLLEHCLNGIMADRTRILVTHQLYILPNVDQVIVMGNGTIVEQDSYDGLMSKGGEFYNLMLVHGGIKKYKKDRTASGASTPSSRASSVHKNSQHNPLLPLREESTDAGPKPTDKYLFNDSTKKTTAAEERFVGAVDWIVYKNYIIAAGGVLFSIVALGSVVLWNITRIYTDYWIAKFSSQSPSNNNVNSFTFASVYLALGVLQGILAAASSLSFSWGGIRATRKLHNQAARRMLHAPTFFFDTNPTGRIISRFSKDQDALDNSMPETFRAFIHTFGLTFFTFLTMILVDYFFSIPLVLLLGLYYVVQTFYRASSRELKRLESLTRSPLYAQFSETLTGLSTIRAFNQQHRFTLRNQSLLDTNNQAVFVQTAIQRWLGIRLETVGNLIILSASCCCYIFKVSPALAGLTISYALSITGTMNWCIRQFADLETQIISSERIGYYANKLPQEARTEAEIEALSFNESSLLINDPQGTWPEEGAIEIKNLSMRYRPELPPVLSNVTLSIKAGERIGIVGRTGAGKSSIMQALFRIVEASEGSIRIDNIDISTLELERLRCHLSIIPQDPVVFAGTVRWNLDPTLRHTDQELWIALEKSHLKETIRQMEGGLDATIQESGDNLSVGQRQLLCLARAMLRPNRILVLDEATANIDMATDALIQKCIRTDFSQCTILTIAHRISTVIDYDKILVLEKGRVVEFDTPAELLKIEDGHLTTLIRETGEKNETMIVIDSLSPEQNSLIN